MPIPFSGSDKLRGPTISVNIVTISIALHQKNGHTIEMVVRHSQHEGISTFLQ